LPAFASSRSRDTSWSASAPSLSTALDRVALVLATGFGAGYSPVAPGTAGSALTVLILWIVPFSRAGLLVFLVAAIVAGTWAAQRAERSFGTKDPGAIVIDEVAGMTLTVAPFALTPAVLLVGFVLFRIFDVTKPFPARASQHCIGGIGVMVDDLIAGLYALIVIVIGRAVFAWP
jgi:phosphatidylglycerophosphatase A